MYTRSISRKIKEAYYAVELERELTKDEILEYNEMVAELTKKFNQKQQ